MVQEPSHVKQLSPIHVCKIGLIKPVWVGDLGTRTKNPKFGWFGPFITLCPASPEKEDQKRCRFPCHVDSAGPVSPTCIRFIRPKAGNAP